VTNKLPREPRGICVLADAGNKLAGNGPDGEALLCLAKLDADPPGPPLPGALLNVDSSGSVNADNKLAGDGPEGGAPAGLPLEGTDPSLPLPGTVDADNKLAEDCKAVAPDRDGGADSRVVAPADGGGADDGGVPNINVGRARENGGGLGGLLILLLPYK